eukprot:1706377-Rhodomonas_salina.2
MEADLSRHHRILGVQDALTPQSRHASSYGHGHDRGYGHGHDSSRPAPYDPPFPRHVTHARTVTSRMLVRSRHVTPRTRRDREIKCLNRHAMVQSVWTARSTGIDLAP